MDPYREPGEIPPDPAPSRNVHAPANRMVLWKPRQSWTPRGALVFAIALVGCFAVLFALFLLSP